MAYYERGQAWHALASCGRASAFMQRSSILRSYNASNSSKLASVPATGLYIHKDTVPPEQ